MKKGAFALALAVLGALFVPSWAVQLACYLALAVTALSFAYSGLTRRMISVEREVAELRAHARATVDVALSVHNGSMLPIAYLSLRDRPGSLYALGPTQTILPLRPNGTGRLAYTLRTGERGVHTLGPVVIGSSDPLGLFPWERTVACLTRVTVFPPLGIVRTRVDAGAVGGAIRVVNTAFEDPSLLRAVREYLPGDDPRRIHWKTTARLGSLHTMEYESAVASPCLVILDLRTERYPQRLRYHFVERAVETAATLVATAAGSRQATALCIAGKSEEEPGVAPFGKGLGHTIRLLTILARVEPVEGGADPLEAALAAGLRVPTGGRLCLVGPSPERSSLERATRGAAARVEVYRVGAGREAVGVGRSRAVRVYDVRTYGEELAGD